MLSASPPFALLPFVYHHYFPHFIPGSKIGNGTWLNVGGNQAVGPGGLNAAADTAPYDDGDGGMALRSLNVCTDETCDWSDNPANYMTTRRCAGSLFYCLDFARKGGKRR